MRISFLPSFRKYQGRRWNARSRASMPPVELLEDRRLLAANALNMIKLPDFEGVAAYSGIRGQGQAIAIIDSGFDLNHPSFGPDADSNGIGDRIIYQYDFADNDADASEPVSNTSSHGSFVTSLAAGSTLTIGGSTIRGVAQQASIVALKAGDASGDIPDDAVLAALDWVIDNATAMNIGVVNMSFGRIDKIYDQALFRPLISSRLRSLEQLSVICVAAAGNYYDGIHPGNGSVMWPRGTQGVANVAADENTIAVGAVLDTNFSSGQWSQLAEQQAFFSQRHERLLDVVAPGVEMQGANNTGGIAIGSHGTSYSSPLVAGAAVLAQQRAQQVLGRRLKMSEFRALVQNTGISLLDSEVSEGGSNFSVPNSLDAFKLLNIKGMMDGITPNLSAVPRAVPTAALAQPITQNGGSATQGRAHLTWDPVPDCAWYSVSLANVPPSGGWTVIWSSSAHIAGQGVQGTFVDAAWTRPANQTNRYVWWVKAWNADPKVNSSASSGEWSYARSLYLTSDVPVPASPSYVGLASQGFKFGVKFSESAYTAVYDIQVERQTVASSWVSEYDISDLLHNRFSPGSELPAGSYRTRARARNADNESSSWGSWGLFTVSDIQYPAPTYLGATTVLTDHVFRWTDSNPIGQYAARVMSGTTQVRLEFTTEPEIKFTQSLPVGSYQLQLFSFSEFATQSSVFNSINFSVVADVAIPIHPVITSPSSFDGDVMLQWTQAPEADHFQVLVWNSQNAAIVNKLRQYGASLLLELKTGQYQVWVRAYNSAGQVLNSWAPGTSIGVANSILPAATGVSASTTGQLVTITWNANAKAKYYEVWIGRAVPNSQDLEYEVIRSRSEDAPVFHASLGIGTYRVWLRTWNNDDDYDQTNQTPWSSTVQFSVA